MGSLFGRVIFPRVQPWLKSGCLLVGATLLAGWHHVLSEEAFFSVDPGARYSEVRANPQAWLGSTLLLAGVISDYRATSAGTTLEILCYSRDEQDAPQEFDANCGRFLARTSGELDPEAYRKGRRVTLTGLVAGKQVFPGGEFGEEVLVFEIGEIYLWPLPEKRRYYPAYPWYDPWYDPFYHRPYWHRYPYRHW
ncbi:hypothetical protein DESUT3_01600 [Desulfuromonas versatilis]|uniref:Outer membrane lipoprotein Slp n=1 Tax=Desulfuromonas versatilis TaxID=2802975 RepID=A0ABN6DSA8_9BACT|nr:Slp family lipoprotein [Desulfuromonas versatilis]BCR03091.1 hypothetical protein DESUT3_01600 [Desulfuromonas versatilis]